MFVVFQFVLLCCVQSSECSSSSHPFLFLSSAFFCGCAFVDGFREKRFSSPFQLLQAAEELKMEPGASDY